MAQNTKTLRATTVLFLAACALTGLLAPVRAQGKTLELPDALTERMAQVAKGESGANPTAPACVMRNRILAGWSAWRVLDHFYAHPLPVSAEELDAVREVLRTGAKCDPAAYFQWSTADVQRVQPNADAWLYSVDGNHYYSRDALRQEG